MPKTGYVYILANQKNGTLYTGVTSNIAERMEQHKTKAVKGFTEQYKVTRLVYYETFNNMTEAIAREKAIKKWNRAWKIKIIQEANPEWEELPADNVL